jgi:hypothetical protein
MYTFITEYRTHTRIYIYIDIKKEYRNIYEHTHRAYSHVANSRVLFNAIIKGHSFVLVSIFKENDKHTKKNHITLLLFLLKKKKH